MSPRRSRDRVATPRCHLTRGFTLLELILSLVLMSALLTTTWMLMGAFQQRLERSQIQAEERQLIRSIHRTLEEDLWSVHRQAIVGREADGATTQPTGLAFAIAESSSATNDGSPDNFGTETSASNSTDRSASRATSDGPQMSDDATNGNVALNLATDSASPSTVLSRDVDQVVMSAWLAPNSFFLGTSQALMFDRLPSAEAETPTAALVSPMDPTLAGGDTAAIPDSIRRVVYAFSSPRSALVSDRPIGLVRCELTMHQLTSVQTTSTESDLLLLVRDDLPEMIGVTVAPAVAGTDPSDRDPSRESAKTVSSSLANDLAARTAQLDPSQAPLDFSRSLDYVPEIVTFSLRYHDGSSWSSSYDSRLNQGKLPVAVEVRFQLQSDLPKPEASDAVTDPLLEGSEIDSASPLDQLNETGELESTDDTLRSALTKPPEEHRYVILLRSPDQRPPISRDSFSESETTDVSPDALTDTPEVDP